MKCLNCQGETELNAQKNYCRCKSCKSIFSIMGDTLYPFPVDESVRSTMEMALGFTGAENPAEKNRPPENCPSCQAMLEIAGKDSETYARCSSCGILYSIGGGICKPIDVLAPGDVWNPVFQATFETKLGFTYKLRKKPLGIPE